MSKSRPLPNGSSYKNDVVSRWRKSNAESPRSRHNARSGSMGVSGSPFRNVGRIVMLGDADKPDVGPSMQVAYPGHAMEGLEPWVELEGPE